MENDQGFKEKYILEGVNGREYLILAEAGKHYLLKDLKTGDHIIAYNWHSEAKEWGRGNYFSEKQLHKAAMEFYVKCIGITSNSDGIEISGHFGTYYVIDEKEWEGELIYLLEHEAAGDEAACVIVNKDGMVILEDVWNGFSDLED